jgi:hypothetical protein
VTKRRVVVTAVFETFWKFACERQRVFFRRVAGDEGPWTDDPILQANRFTNAYRASDRVSQYLIRHVIYRGESAPHEVFFRTILFKLFNKIETWELLEGGIGEILWSEFSFDRYATLLGDAKRRGNRLYSSAYIMPSGSGAVHDDEKHRSHLRLIQLMMKENAPQRIAESASMKEAFNLLSGFPTVGPFLAYQFVTDLNYSELTDFSEMEFVVPGPGARSGIRKCFQDMGHLSEADVIRYVAEHQAEEFDKRGLDFQTLWGRPLQLVDCQNLFCEVDKYARVAHPETVGLGNRTKIKRRFAPNPEPQEFWFPPKWGINERIATSQAAVSRRISYVE